MREYLRTIAQQTFSDADGKLRTLKLREGLECPALDRLEQRLGVRLPNDYREFFAATDGADLFGEDVFQAYELHLLDAAILPIHAWGNGDFTCLRFDGGTFRDVVFMNHTPSVVVAIAPTFSDWLKRAVSEIARLGCLLHPMDYQHHDYPGGLYAHVLGALRGVDCELNRE